MKPIRAVRQRAMVFLACLAMSISAVALRGLGEAGGLKVYFIDVEGGQATLFVTPTHESLLIDAGWPGHEGRDADRIVAAARSAGLHQIDYLLLTHYHTDHVGGVPQLAARIPIRTFIDHGSLRELDHGMTEQGYGEYQKVLGSGSSAHILARPGDILPLRGMQVRVISADGEIMAHSLPHAGQPNAFCASSEERTHDQTENGRSVGVEITFGKLRILDLGDLTWDKERELMCPVNKLGRIDVYIVSHHGLYQSSSPALVDAIRARVGIMDNGATKGGSLGTLETLTKAPGLHSLWQLHRSREGGTLNTADDRIANLEGNDSGYSLLLIGQLDGSFMVANTRNGFAESYAAGR